MSGGRASRGCWVGRRRWRLRRTDRQRTIVWRAGWALAGALATALIAAPPVAAAPRTFTNPLLPSGPDPWIARDGGVFYLMVTQGDRLAIRRATTLAGLRNGEAVTVWTPPAHGANAVSIWAPELHRIDGRWFIYYTAARDGHDDDAHRGIFVLENDAADPTTGSWIDRGRLATAHPGIDGTTFAYAGRRYFAYSPYLGTVSGLALVAMSNPWTLVGPETVVARPDRRWETQGGRAILEGPEFLAGPRGDLFLTYSAGACWSDDYALGLLSAARGSDPLDARAWRKADRPVLAKAPAAGVYATGHNGFFTSPDGRETWVVFHANPGAGLGCTSRRAPHAERIRFDAAGRPEFPVPAHAGRQVREPGGEIGTVAPRRAPS